MNPLLSSPPSSAPGRDSADIAVILPAYRGIPVHYMDRSAERFSKLSTLQDGIRILLTIFRITRSWKSLFFTALSMLAGLLGILPGLPVLREYLHCSYICNIPSAIPATGLESLAVLLLGAGLVLNAPAYQRHIPTESCIRTAPEICFPRRCHGKRGE